MNKIANLHIMATADQLKPLNRLHRPQNCKIKPPFFHAHRDSYSTFTAPASRLLFTSLSNPPSNQSSLTQHCAKSIKHLFFPPSCCQSPSIHHPGASTSRLLSPFTLLASISSPSSPTYRDPCFSSQLHHPAHQ